MTRLCRRARTATVLCAVGLMTSGAYTQSRQQYSLSLDARIVGGGYLGTPPRAWQVYREGMAEVEISISRSNEGEDALHFNSGMIERAMRFRLFSMDDATGELQESAVSVTSRGVIDQDGFGPFITLPDQLLLAEGMKGVVWIMGATRPDGRPFTPGRYRFEVEVRDIRSALTTVTSDPPSNLVMGQWQSGVARGHVELVLTAPSTPAEVATMYVQRGDVAFERRQYEDALALFGRAVDANPADAGTALQRLGGTYLTLGRYAEAVPVLQRLPILGRGIAEGYLALAYVGAGHEAEAMTLLQRGGRSEAEMAAEIESLRERVRQRPIR